MSLLKMMTQVFFGYSMSENIVFLAKFQQFTILAKFSKIFIFKSCVS
jgi:hypothetical protein